MEQQTKSSFHKHKNGNTTYWRKPGCEISYNKKRWKEFKFEIESPHPEECEDRTDEKMRVILYIFGFAIFYSFWKLLKRDWSFGFGWSSMGFHATYGIQTKKGGNIWSSDGSTGMKSYWDFPWSKRRRWEKWLDQNGNVAYFNKSYNWYQTKWRKIFGRKPNPLYDYDYDTREAIKKSIEQEYPLEYTLKSGEVQKMRIFCYFSESSWVWRALPFINSKDRCCNFRVTEELGEEAGSYKGGVIASAVNRLPNESMESCIERIKAKRW